MVGAMGLLRDRLFRLQRRSMIGAWQCGRRRPALRPASLAARASARWRRWCWPGAPGGACFPIMKAAARNRCWRWRDGHPALAELRLSTHKTSLIDALALAEALGRRRPELIVVGIEAAQFTLGAALSPAVASALDEAVVRVYGELRRLEEGLTTACTSSR